MKIAIVVEHLDGLGGGELARWIAQEMLRRGHEVHVLCHDVAARVNRFRQATQASSFDAHRSRRAHGAAEADHGGLHIHRLRGVRLKTALGFRIFGARARAWCRRGKFDVVHSFTVACPGDIYHAQAGVYAAMHTQTGAMGTGPADAWRQLLRSLPGKRRTLLTLEERAVRRAKRVVSLCPMMTAQFGAYYGAREARRGGAGRVVTLVTPRLGGARGAAATGGRGDAEKEAAERRGWFRGHYGLGEKDRVALFVGHDFRRKGLRQAIEAIGRTRDWKLVVAGLGRVRPYVELAQRLGLAAGEGDEVTRWQGDRGTWGETDAGVGGGRVMFIGPTKEMEAVYAAADVLLLPTFYEVSNVVVLEALERGLPVVSTAYLGVAEVVRAYRAGHIVEDPRDAGALARALEALPAAGSAEAAALARRARAAVAGFSAEGYVERLEELYREVG